jgi:hypothetical protein
MKTFKTFTQNEEVKKPAAKRKMTSALLGSIVLADDITNHKDGTFTLRRGYYYTNGQTEKDYEKVVLSRLNNEGYSVTVVDSGNVWKEFKGGAAVKNQSHWWVKIKF